MFSQNPDRGLAAFEQSTRAFQGIAAEVGDYSQRMIAESTSALGQLSNAKSVPEYMEIMSAYSKKALEEHIQQMTRVAGMFAFAASDHARAIQSMMMPTCPR